MSLSEDTAPDAAGVARITGAAAAGAAAVAGAATDSDGRGPAGTARGAGTEVISDAGAGAGVSTSAGTETPGVQTVSLGTTGGALSTTGAGAVRAPRRGTSTTAALPDPRATGTSTTGSGTLTGAVPRE
ncbi:MAG: hypothetical protein FGM52_04580 [Mycobacterium sp.]|nr:hypothetical protein [Mycobacterium sp.]